MPSACEVQARERLVEGVRDVVVELLVLLVGDLDFGPGPDRAGLVDLLRLLGLGALRPWCSPRLGPVLEQDRHARYGRNRCARSGAGATRPGTPWRRPAGAASPRCRAAPAPPPPRSCSRCGRRSAQSQPCSSPALRVDDLDLVGHHEHRIEADAELADQLEVASRCRRESCVEEALRCPSARSCRDSRPDRRGSCRCRCR